jgi:2'-5' RNA ligase
MGAQLSLPGFGAAPPPKDLPTDRLFFAIRPDADSAERIAWLARRVRDEHGLMGRPIPTGRLHVSLLDLGDYAGLPQKIVAAASRAAATVVAPPVEIAFDRVVGGSLRHGRSAVVLRGAAGIAAVTALRRVIVEAMTKAAIKLPAERRFMPHVTLLYDRSVSEQPVETIAWTAREFVLVQSLLGWSRHVVLERWPLRG